MRAGLSDEGGLQFRLHAEERRLASIREKLGTQPLSAILLHQLAAVTENLIDILDSASSDYEARRPRGGR